MIIFPHGFNHGCKLQTSCRVMVLAGGPFRYHLQYRIHKGYKEQVLLQVEMTPQLVLHCLRMGYYPNIVHHIIY